MRQARSSETHRNHHQLSIIVYTVVRHTPVRVTASFETSGVCGLIAAERAKQASKKEDSGGALVLIQLKPEGRPAYSIKRKEPSTSA